jgi:hypothetical protein
MRSVIEQRQLVNFQNALANLIDEYLKDNINIYDMRTILQDEIASDLISRRAELGDKLT